MTTERGASVTPASQRRAGTQRSIEPRARIAIHSRRLFRSLAERSGGL